MIFFSYLELLHHGLEIIVVESVLVTEAGRFEHVVDELPHLLVGQLLGLGDVDERVKQLGQLLLVHGPVPV